eukprot:TRINITY_DN114042_c0_g1_i1.p1 TRINITY_DN114042_c0_g1~~TRINITY_DN114042_c0_g1_i1.p1  ORF type:complete len:131 (-),score=17.26 TRINITY_DN114042_c0_g1_i1:101-493(-)
MATFDAASLAAQLKSAWPDHAAQMSIVKTKGARGDMKGLHPGGAKAVATILGQLHMKCDKVEFVIALAEGGVLFDGAEFEAAIKQCWPAKDGDRAANAIIAASPHGWTPKEQTAILGQLHMSCRSGKVVF